MTVLYVVLYLLASRALVSFIIGLISYDKVHDFFGGGSDGNVGIFAIVLITELIFVVGMISYIFSFGCYIFNKFVAIGERTRNKAVEIKEKREQRILAYQKQIQQEGMLSIAKSNGELSLPKD